ncbi:MAG: penicillin acylase family protein, partial [Candidatus Latescibacterota bacterium]
MHITSKFANIRSKHRLRALAASAAVLLAMAASSCSRNTPYDADLLWDTWGVPHIFAQDATSLFYAYGWAQMESHGDRILNLYGVSRGRAAEYWGERFIQSDRYIRTLGIPQRSQEWYDAQKPIFR